jgi:hypothetical protein
MQHLLTNEVLTVLKYLLVASSLKTQQVFMYTVQVVHTAAGAPMLLE